MRLYAFSSLVVFINLTLILAAPTPVKLPFHSPETLEAKLDRQTRKASQCYGAACQQRAHADRKERQAVSEGMPVATNAYSAAAQVGKSKDYTSQAKRARKNAEFYQAENERYHRKADAVRGQIAERDARTEISDGAVTEVRQSASSSRLRSLIASLKIRSGSGK